MAGSKRSRPWGSYVSQAAKAARYAGRVVGTGMKAYRTLSGNKTRERRKTNSGSNVTFQHDYAHIYTRRRAPRRVRKAARRQQKQFNSSLVKSLGQKTFNVVGGFTSTVTPTVLADTQGTYDVGLFGGFVIANQHEWDDLYQICSAEGLITNTGRIHFKSATLDLQLQNAGTDTVLVVDMYEVVARREGRSYPSGDWDRGMNAQTIAPGASNKATINTLNCVPFDAPGFGAKWLVTKKMRYRIAPGQSVYFQMRDPRNHVFETGRFNYDGTNINQKMFKGMSKGYMFAMRAADTVFTGSPPVIKGEPFTFKAIWSKNYHYCTQQTDSDLQGYLV